MATTPGEAGKQAAQTRPAAPIRVLLVEDDRNDAELALVELDDGGLAHQSLVVDNERDYLVALNGFRPDIVLSDVSLPGFSGQGALALLRKRDADLPFIFVSATLGEDAAIEALRNGATDYILKQNPARLASAVRRALAEAEERRAVRHAQAELIRAQRFESLAMLAGGLSHDLRNLLQPLLLAGENLRNYQGDPKVARLGTLVHDCGKRGLEMVQSMLSFARGARHEEQVRVGALMDALGLLLQGSVPRGIRMTTTVDDPDLVFAGNHTELQQCLLNLCLNAIQAMNQGGNLGIEAAQRTLDAAFFKSGETARPGRYLCLSVIDDGPGMSPDVLARMFEPFFTTKAAGTGLGLLSCQRIVASHGGVMRVASAPGQGARFDLYVPLQSAVANGDAETGEESLEGNGERVLVVAEVASELSLLTDTLNAWGYHASACQSGTAALQWIDANGLPDVVLADADMSLLTGVRTLAALVDRSYAGATVLLVRPDAPPAPDELPPLPRLSLLDKPVTTRKLLRTLRLALPSTSG